MFLFILMERLAAKRLLVSAPYRQADELQEHKSHAGSLCSIGEGKEVEGSELNIAPPALTLLLKECGAVREDGKLLLAFKYSI